MRMTKEEKVEWTNIQAAWMYEFDLPDAVKALLEF